MRRLTLRTLACVLFALAAAATPAAAQSAGAGSAVCTTTINVPRDHTFGDLLLTSGNYRVTVLDTGDLNCGVATHSLAAVRGRARQRGARPAGT